MAHNERLLEFGGSLQGDDETWMATAAEEESVAKPRVGDYIRGNVHQGGKEIEQHEGIVVGKGKDPDTYQVVDPGSDDFTGGAHNPNPHPDYKVREVEGKDAEILNENQIPWYKRFGVESIRKQVKQTK